METKERLVCPAIWFSGFFGLGTLVHLIRLLLGFPVAISHWVVPLRVSAVLVVVFGGLSAALLYLGCKWPCCAAK